MNTSVIVLIILTVLRYCIGSRILAISPTASYSHQQAFHPLWRELSIRGHQVVLVTTDPINDPNLTNLTEIDLHDLSYSIWNKNIAGKVEGSPMNILTVINLFLANTYEISEAQFKDSRIQAILRNQNEKFDLVITEYFYPFAFALGYRFQCPYIAVASLEPFSQTYREIGASSHPVLNPEPVLPVEETLTFFDRFLSVMYSWLFSYLYPSFYPRQEGIIRNYIGTGYPPIVEMIKNTSMLFVNSDQIMFRVRSLPPNVINFGGGTHLKPLKPLPKDLQNFLDGATEGFIYFSLGSNVKSKDLKKELLSVLLKTFGELPYKVLWKFELDKLEELPKNVMIYKWIPQQDVLRHPNIKLFITQGGMQSLDEALHNHIPVVGMPFFGDQPSNIKRIAIKGMGLFVDHVTLDKETFKNAIFEVINNPKYKKRVKELSDLVLDQPMSGLQQAVWWTEYVIRHNGTAHFRNPAIDLPLYQYYLLDVIGMCLFISLILSYSLFKLIKQVMTTLNGNSKLKKQ